VNEINPLLTRRDALGLFGAAASLASFPSLAQAPAAHAPAAPRPAFSAAHKPKPLRFDPAKLEGLSEKLIRSHWENNYGGSVKSLNLIETRLAAAMREPDFPAVVYGGLKREELHRVGSVVLHEHYFDNLGGDGRAGGDVAKALSQVYGSTAAWEAEFRRTAMSLAGGSGWCLLTFNAATGELRNQWAWDHMHGAVAGLPLLVLDMYEHSYHMDYGTAAAKYVDAFFANVDWGVVEERYQRARRFTT
jgi:Fe-Mn family superoxide dismutase